MPRSWQAWADADLFRLASSRLALHFDAVEQRHFFQAARALEDIGVDGVGSRRPPVAAVAARLVQPVHLRLDLALQLLKGALQLIHIHRRAVVLGDEGRSRGKVDGDRRPPFHQRRQGRPARAAERVQHQVAGLGVMLDVLADGVVRLLRPVGVHVVDGGGLGGGDGLVEGLDLVLVGRRVVGRGVLFHKAPQVGVGAGGIIALRHLGDGGFEERWLAGRG